MAGGWSPSLTGVGLGLTGAQECHWPPVGFTIIIEPFDDRTPTIANPILHFR